MEMKDFTKTLAGIRSKQKGKKAPKKGGLKSVLEGRPARKRGEFFDIDAEDRYDR